MDRLTELLGPTVGGLGYELWGIERARQGGSQILRLFIDCDRGITISDCEKVRRHVGDVIEVEDVLWGEYTLEVSSPGLERRFFSLEQHNNYIGSAIKVRLWDNQSGRRNYMGVLSAVSTKSLIITENEDLIEIEFAKIDRSNLVDNLVKNRGLHKAID